jgi:hypothetical protein
MIEQPQSKFIDPHPELAISTYDPLIQGKIAFDIPAQSKLFLKSLDPERGMFQIMYGILTEKLVQKLKELKYDNATEHQLLFREFIASIELHDGRTTSNTVPTKGSGTRTPRSDRKAHALNDRTGTSRESESNPTASK